MKKFYLIVLTIFLASATFAAGVKTLKASTWDIANPNSWAPYGLPGSGDTVIIPAGKQLIAAGSFSFPINVYLKVYGEILMTGSPIDVYFDATSTIIVYNGG
ncbi:MAG TPA: hypothetical protein VHK91_07325, partial [Flavisolibacter sp.]|nr:hypothetical protein [Flavisolibacter sp.]